MKLHLPFSLRKALMVCLSALALPAASLTIGSAALSGAVVSLALMQAAVGGELVFSTDEDDIVWGESGDAVWSGGAWVNGSGALFNGAAGVIHVALSDAVSVADMTIARGDYVFTGVERLTVSGMLTVQNGTSASFDSALMLNNLTNRGELILNGDITLNNAWSGGGVFSGSGNVVLTRGSDLNAQTTLNDDAALEIRSGITKLKTVIEGDVVVSGDCGGGAFTSSGSLKNNGLEIATQNSDAAIHGRLTLKDGGGMKVDYGSTVASVDYLVMEEGTIIRIPSATLVLVNGGFIDGNITLYNGGTVKTGGDIVLGSHANLHADSRSNNSTFVRTDEAVNEGRAVYVIFDMSESETTTLTDAAFLEKLSKLGIDNPAIGDEGGNGSSNISRIDSGFGIGITGAQTIALQYTTGDLSSRALKVDGAAMLALEAGQDWKMDRLTLQNGGGIDFGGMLYGSSLTVEAGAVLKMSLRGGYGTEETQLVLNTATGIGSDSKLRIILDGEVTQDMIGYELFGGSWWKSEYADFIELEYTAGAGVTEVFLDENGRLNLTLADGSAPEIIGDVLEYDNADTSFAWGRDAVWDGAINYDDREWVQGKSAKFRSVSAETVRVEVEDQVEVQDIIFAKGSLALEHAENLTVRGALMVWEDAEVSVSGALSPTAVDNMGELTLNDALRTPQVINSGKIIINQAQTWEMLTNTGEIVLNANLTFDAAWAEGAQYGGGVFSGSGIVAITKNGTFTEKTEFRDDTSLVIRSGLVYIRTEIVGDVALAAVMDGSYFTRVGDFQNNGVYVKDSDSRIFGTLTLRNGTGLKIDSCTLTVDYLNMEEVTTVTGVSYIRMPSGTLILTNGGMVDGDITMYGAGKLKLGGDLLVGVNANVHGDSRSNASVLERSDEAKADGREVYVIFDMSADGESMTDVAFLEKLTKMGEDNPNRGVEGGGGSSKIQTIDEGLGIGIMGVEEYTLTHTTGNLADRMLKVKSAALTLDAQGDWSLAKTSLLEGASLHIGSKVSLGGLVVDEAAGLSIELSGSVGKENAQLTITDDIVGWSKNNKLTISLTGKLSRETMDGYLLFAGGWWKDEYLDYIDLQYTRQGEVDTIFINSDGTLTIYPADRWTWRGGAQNTWLTNSKEGWKDYKGSSPDDHVVWFTDDTATPEGVVSIQGAVSPSGVVVSDGDWVFESKSDSAKIKAGAEDADDKENSGRFVVGGGDAASSVTLKVTTEGFLDFVLQDGGTLKLAHESALGSSGSIYWEGGTLEVIADTPANIDSRFADYNSGKNHSEAVKVKLSSGQDITWSDENGVLVAMEHGIEKSGSNKLTLQREEAADATHAGALSVSEGSLALVVNVAKGKKVKMTGDITVGSSKVAKLAAAGDEAELVLHSDEGALELSGKWSGAGRVVLDEGLFILIGDASEFSGTLRLGSEASVSFSGNDALGGSASVLELAGADLTATTASQVQAGKVVVEADSRLYGEMLFTGALSGSGSLIATSGSLITLSGDMSSYLAKLVAEQDGAIRISGQAGDAPQIGNELNGNGVFEFDQEVDIALAGKVTGHAEVHNIGKADVVISGTENDSDGALIVTGAGNILLGADSDAQAVWSGTKVGGSGSGRVVLQNVALTGEITEGSVVVDVLEGRQVNAAGTNVSHISDIVVRKGGKLKGVIGDIFVGVPGKTSSTSVTVVISEENIGAGAAAGALIEGGLNITIGSAVTEADKDRFRIDLNNRAIISMIRANLQNGETWLTILSGGSITIDDSNNDSFWCCMGENLKLLHTLGFNIQGTNGGSIIMGAEDLNVWFVTDDPALNSGNELSDFGELCRATATVVDHDQTLRVHADANDDSMMNDDEYAKRSFIVNNLLGVSSDDASGALEGLTRFVAYNDAADKTKDRLNVMFVNSVKNKTEIPDAEVYPSASDGSGVLGSNTTFEGYMVGDVGVDFAKSGIGILTIGTEDGRGGVQLADGGFSLSQGGLVFQGAVNKLAFLDFAYGQKADVNGALTLRNGRTEIGALLESGAYKSGNVITLAQKAQMELTGESSVRGTTIVGDGSGALSLASGVALSISAAEVASDAQGARAVISDVKLSLGEKAILALADLAELRNSDTSVAAGGAIRLDASAKMTGGALALNAGAQLELGTSQGNTVTSLTGAGSISAQENLGLRRRGELTVLRDGVFSGQLVGAGALTVATGANMRLNVGEWSPSVRAWDLTAKGRLTVDVHAAAPQLVSFGSVMVGEGATFTYVLNTDHRDCSKLKVDMLAFSEGATFVIESVGSSALQLDDLGRYVLGEVEIYSGLAKVNVQLKGSEVFGTWAADTLGVDDDGYLYLTFKEDDGSSVLPPGDVPAPDEPPADEEEPGSRPKLDKNAQAGSNMLFDKDDPFFGTTENPFSEPHTDLVNLADAVLDMMRNGEYEKLDKTLAAAAGSSVSVLGAALNQDLKRQLSALRARAAGDASEAASAFIGGVHDRRFRVWMNGEAGYHKLSANHLAPGYSLSSWGGSVGVDMALKRQASVGLVVSALYGSLKVDAADSATGDIDTTYLSAFVRTQQGAWSHALVVSAGVADVALNRTVYYGSGSYATQGSTDGLAVGALYELAYIGAMNADGSLLLQPVFNVEFRHAAVSGYAEKGSDAGLAVDDMKMDSLTFGLGARVQSAIGRKTLNRAAFVDAHLMLKIDAGDLAGTSQNVLLHGNGVAQEVESAKIGFVGVEVGVGVSLPVSRKGGALFASGSVELRQGYMMLDASVGYRLSF